MHKPIPRGYLALVGGQNDDPHFVLSPGAVQRTCYSCKTKIWFNTKIQKIMKLVSNHTTLCISCYAHQYQKPNTIRVNL